MAKVSAHPKRTRPLGAVLCRSHSNDVPLRYPSTVPTPSACSLTRAGVGWGNLWALDACRNVPSESTATGLEPHHTHDVSDMHRRLRRSPRARSRADRSDPPRPQAQTLRGEGGTHRHARFVSAESELGTLPFSLLFWRPLHTRGRLGRSAVLRRTHSNHVPLRYPRTVPHRMEGPLSTP